MKQTVDDKLAEYLGSADPHTRLQKLAQVDEIPLPAIKQLLTTAIESEERQMLLSCVSSTNSLELEDFLSRSLDSWDSNMMAKAIEVWVTKTPCQLWHRVVGWAGSKLLPQRVVFTLLQNSLPLGGSLLLPFLSRPEYLETFSPTFTAELYSNLLRWNYHEPHLLEFAENLLKNTHRAAQYGRALPYCAQFLARHKPGIDISQFPEAWRNLLGGLDIWRITLDKTLATKQKRWANGALLKRAQPPTWWPHMWSRHLLTQESLVKFLGNWENDPKAAHLDLAQCLDGLSPELLTRTLQENDLCLRHWLNRLSHRLRIHAQMLSPCSCKTECSPEILADTRRDHPQSATLHREQLEFFQTYSPQLTNQATCRWSLTFPELPIEKSQGINHFEAISNLESADDHELNSLTQEVRGAPYLTRLHFMQMLRHSQQKDQAVLRLLEYLSSEDQWSTKIILDSLLCLGTPKAIIESIHTISRGHVDDETRLFIIQRLGQVELSPFHDELEETYNYLNKRSSSSMGREQLLAMRELFSPKSTELSKANTPPEASQAGIDEQLQKKIQLFDNLATESQRALRTALFFQQQATSHDQNLPIDLSPVIDMQYKALEMAFRAELEPYCQTVIRNQVISRRLDTIGYSRPVVVAMNNFEAYISQLPIIDTVPFFSKFKLRKMLRSLSNFNQSKRFTLDSLKAFGLFFLCFSRKSCQFGLANLMPIAEWNDQQLAEFVKRVHIFQDYRNRAAHEGFDSQALSRQDENWEQVNGIVQDLFQLKQGITALMEALEASQQTPSVSHKLPSSA